MDGVVMGFTNFYMGNLKCKTFQNIKLNPHIYGHYVNEIFLQIISEQQLEQLKIEFENQSVLKFTYELNVDKKFIFRRFGNHQQ